VKVRVPEIVPVVANAIAAGATPTSNRKAVMIEVSATSARDGVVERPRAGLYPCK
jgi:hypothetical protein